MKKRLKLKPFVIPMIYTLVVMIVMSTVYFIRLTGNDETDEMIYVTAAILDNTTPVVNLETVIIKPYTNQDVTIGIDYYNKNDSEEAQQKSLIFYSNTYMPNSGVDYVLKDTFDVVSILDGEVIEVKEDELLGKSVTVRHDTDLISVYQGLGEIAVEKDQHVSSGEKIGTSGISDLTSSLGNHLHFELMFKGITVDPEDYYNKKLSELE